MPETGKKKTWVPQYNLCTSNNTHNKELIRAWLSSPYVNANIMQRYQHIFNAWVESDKVNGTTLMKTFKLRLYNELFNKRA